MANHKNERAELKAQINELNERIKALEIRNTDLVARHVQDAKVIKNLHDNVGKQMQDLQEAMTEIYCKSICEEYGEPVLDEETKELLGKRLVFRALRKNNYKVNLSEELFYPEDEKYISTITIGVTYPQEGERNETENASEQRGDKHES